MENKCEHEIGVLYDLEDTDLITLKDLVRLIKEAHDRYSYEIKKGLYSPKYCYLPKPPALGKYFDKRNNWFHRFNYCPICGEELKWRELKKEAEKLYSEEKHD